MGNRCAVEALRQIVEIAEGEPNNPPLPRIAYIAKTALVEEAERCQQTWWRRFAESLRTFYVR